MPFLRRLLARGRHSACTRCRSGCPPPRPRSRWPRCTACSRTSRASTTTTSAAGPTSTSRARATPPTSRRRRQPGRLGIVDRRQHLRLRVHGRRGQQPADLRAAQAPLGRRACCARFGRGHRAGLGHPQERGDLVWPDRARPARLRRRPAAARRRAGSCWCSRSACRCGSASCSRCRRRATSTRAPRPSTSTTSTTTSSPTPGARDHRRALRALRSVDHSIQRCGSVMPPRARAPLRPLRAVRPRPGPLHAVRSADRGPAHRAHALRRVPDPGRRARGGARPAAGAAAHQRHQGHSQRPGDRRASSGSSTTSSTISPGCWAR